MRPLYPTFPYVPALINGRRTILLVIYFTNLLTPVHSSHVATVPLLIDVRAPVLCLAEANTDKKIQLPATDHFGGFSDAKQFFKHSWLSGAVHNVIPHHCARLLGLPKTTIVSNASRRAFGLLRAKLWSNWDLSGSGSGVESRGGERVGYVHVSRKKAGWISPTFSFSNANANVNVRANDERSRQYEPRTRLAVAR